MPRRPHPITGILLVAIAAGCASTPGEGIVVREVREGSILVEIPRDRIEKVVHARGGSGSDKDLIYMEGREEPLSGVVLEQSRDSILVELGEVWSAGRPRSQEAPDRPDLDRLKDEVRKDLLAMGSLEGQILERGKPLPGCKVKAVRLDQVSVLGLLTTWRPGGEFVTVTDEDGKCRFEELPAGAYKIFWWPPWEDGWIRRLPWEPGVKVERKRTATFRPVESRRRVLR